MNTLLGFALSVLMVSISLADVTISAEERVASPGDTIAAYSVTMSCQENVAGLQLRLVDTPDLVSVSAVSSAIDGFDAYFTEDGGAVNVLLVSLDGDLIPPAQDMNLLYLTVQIDSLASSGQVISIDLFEAVASDMFGDSLTVITEAGQILVSDAVDVSMSTTGISCLSVWPNPTNMSVQLQLYVDNDGVVDLAVYDVAGSRRGTVYNGRLSRGTHYMPYKLSVPAGVYFFRIQSNQSVVTRRIVVVRP